MAVNAPTKGRFNTMCHEPGLRTRNAIADNDESAPAESNPSSNDAATLPVSSPEDTTDASNTTTPATNVTLPAMKYVFATSDLSCACNCTYISPACCTTLDGIVHEPAAKKLGVVDILQPNTCCDESTGDMMLMAEGAVLRGDTTFC